MASNCMRYFFFWTSLLQNIHESSWIPIYSASFVWSYGYFYDIAIRKCLCICLSCSINLQKAEASVRLKYASRWVNGWMGSNCMWYFFSELFYYRTSVNLRGFQFILHLFEKYVWSPSCGYFTGCTLRISWTSQICPWMCAFGFGGQNDHWRSLGLLFEGLYTLVTCFTDSLSTAPIKLADSHLSCSYLNVIICPALTRCTLRYAYGPVFLINKWCVECHKNFNFSKRIKH